MKNKPSSWKESINWYFFPIIMLINWIKNLKLVISSFIFRKWSWILGYDVCYKTPNREDPKSGKAFCKRRRGHFGKHCTESGYKFN